MLKWLSSQLNGHKRAPKDSPKHPLAVVQLDSLHWRERGNALIRQSDLSGAEQCYRNGVDIDPSDAICCSNLGYVLGQLGRSAEAREMLLIAVQLDPNDFDALYLLGNLARSSDEWAEAISHYQNALTVKSDFELCRRELCVSLAHSGQIDEARAIAKQGPAMDEDSVDFLFFKGNMHLIAGQNAEACQFFKRAEEKKPNDATILTNLGAAQLKQRNPFAALETYQRKLRLDPDDAQTYAQIGVALQQMGQLRSAIQSYRQALDCNPKDLNLHQSLLCAATHSPDFDQAEYASEAKKYGVLVSSLAKPYKRWLSQPSDINGRPLRVGFVSGDFRSHPVGVFLESILKNIDPTRLTCVAYSTSTAEDAVTARLKPLFAEWSKVATLADQKLAEKIFSDRIDILADLAGHTGLNRLPVFAWRPAPIQVSWLGYWASTGVAEIDYLLTDEVSVPAGESVYFSEQLCYLPDTRLCMSTPVTDQLIEVSPLPFLEKGYITFGSFQILAKMTDQNFAVWSKILARVPGSRLRIQSLPLAFPEAKVAVGLRLELAGIDMGRVDFFGGMPREEYLAAYSEVDVLLDTFPFPGGTTTAEALWMGVPTVTLAGDSMLSRQGMSMLSCVGLTDWVASSELEYIELAVEKATDLHQLAKLRANLRPKVLASSLFDGVKFAKNLEEAFHRMTKTG